MKKFSLIIGLLAGLLFGVATPFSKYLLNEINSFLLAGLLYWGAAVIFTPYIIKNYRKEIQYIKIAKNRKSIWGIIIFGGFLGPVFLLLGLKLANSSSVSIWLNLELVATAILGVLFFKDHLDKTATLGVLFALTAGIVISFQEGVGALYSGLLVLLACICWGIDNHLTALVDGASPQSITFLKGALAGTTNFVIGLILNGFNVPLKIFIFALILGAISYGLSIVMYVTSAQYMGATRSQILFSTGPFWGILAAFIFLSEPLNGYVIMSMVLLAIGIVLTNLNFHKHSHIHDSLSHVHLHKHDDDHHDHEHDKDIDPQKIHSHLHKHESKKHSHKHFPDIHHRHDH